MDLIPNLLPIMSFGAILLLYAIFINYLIAKKRESNYSETHDIGMMDSDLNFEFDFEEETEQRKDAEVSDSSQSVDRQLMTFIKELKKQESIANNKSGVKRKIIVSFDKSLTNLNWFNHN
jgi:hypothetical protein